MVYSEQSKVPSLFRLNVHLSIRTLPTLHYDLWLWTSIVLLVMIVDTLTQHKRSSKTLNLLFLIS
jgi:hypothetical protein